MSINLIEQLQSGVIDQLTEHSSTFFGEEKENTSTAIKGTFAAILAGMIQKVSHEKGSRDLHRLLKSEETREFDIENIFTRSPQTVNGLVNKGTHFLPSIYPGRLREATNAVAAHSGVKKFSSSKMMKVCAPLLLNTLGKQVQGNSLDESGLKSLLNGQKSSIGAFLPDDFADKAELSAFGWTKKEKQAVVAPKKKAKVVKEVKAAPVVQEVVEESNSKAAAGALAGAKATGAGLGIFKWLLPLLAAIALIWFLATRTGCADESKVRSVKTTTEQITEVAKEPVKKVQNVLGKVNEAALTALDDISFAVGSAGSQMMDFIKGGAKGDGRFRFKNLNFASGSSVIDGASGLEVDNIAAIMKAYGDVKVKIEGYTDSRGNADSNLTLSQARADAVRDRLLATGIDAARMSTEGFGAANPIADNETAEGRAENRRIEVVLVK